MALIRGVTRVTSTDVLKVLANIQKIYKGREEQAFWIAQEFADAIDRDFDAIQRSKRPWTKGAFWKNRTGHAAGGWYTEAWKVGKNVGFTISHSANTRYAEQLEGYVTSKKGDTSVNIMMNQYANNFLTELYLLYGGDNA